MIKKLQHLLEAFSLLVFFGLLRLLPLDTASATGGKLGRLIGPHLKAHRTAKENLARFMPELSAQRREQILAHMWDNLGRTATELSQLGKKKITERITFSGIENFPAPGSQVLFFSGHVGNWELLPFVSLKHGIPITLVYRRANNPFVDRMIANVRNRWAGNMFPKGPIGAVKMARAIKNGEAIAMLVDQKMNDGIAVPFFGAPAMTAPAVAQLALRYDLPIIPARIIRKDGVHFEAVTYPTLIIEKTGDNEKDTLIIMETINAMLESWIREYPEQWFWVHQRWPRAD